MKNTKDIKVVWQQQGGIRWEKWWTDKFGKKRAETPGLKEHISFANFDLSRSGIPELIVKSDKSLIIEKVPISLYSTAERILKYHGFSIIPDIQNEQ